MKLNQGFLLVFCVFQSMILSAQDFSDSWRGYFSYNEIVQLSAGNGKVYAASSNAAFTYESATDTMETFSTIQGLEGEAISTNYYSETFDVHVIGYENGLIEIVESDGNVLTEVDIINKATIPPNQKRINHFMEFGDLVYVSTDFGIVEYNLANLEFGDTFFIGPGGSQIKVNQVTVHNGLIHAATQNQGVLRADVTSPNLIDFGIWQSIGSTGFAWLGIASSGDRLFATTNNRRLYDIVDTTFTIQVTYPIDILDFRFFDGVISLVTGEQAFAYDPSNLSVQAQVNLADLVDFTSNFTCSLVYNGSLYVGTGDQGMLRFILPDVINPAVLKPSGPLHNLMFAIDVAPNEIWAVFGGYSQSYGFSGIPGLRKTGVSHFASNEWTNIPYGEINALKNDRDIDFINDVTINPNNPNHVIISSYFAGLVEIIDGVPTTLYDVNNSSLERAFNAFNLSLKGSYDNDGVFWTMTGRVNNAINRNNNGAWSSFSVQDIITSPTSPNLGFSDIISDNQGNRYIGTYRFGVIGFNESGNQIANLDADTGGLPNPDVRALAVDNNNNLWIGTLSGLRVLFNASQLLTEDNPQSQSIIILQDGVPEELLFEQVITDIEVDGSNNKWISTASSGVFYFSSDGQQTIQHFTKDNSPLPANNVFDIEIAPSGEEIYFATEKGLVSFLSGGSQPTETLSDVEVYPNPVRPEYQILGFSDLKDINKGVKIRGLTENVNVKITDVEGNLVAEGQSNRTLRFDSGLNLGIDGGTAIWNGRNFAGNIVASGVYLILISDLDSLETMVKKVMIVR